ncbi:MAG: dihydrofolate reductase family protein [Bacteroidetes bacterium]|nr:dihydrofolate reductase family protein [Bacteroidota bacterium]
MRKLVLYTAVSLDGFIARKNGEVDWLSDYENQDEDYGFMEFFNSVDTMISGNNTHKIMLELEENYPYAEKKIYVLTKDAGLENDEQIEYLRSKRSIISFVEDLKSDFGSNIWLVGGGKTNAFFLEAGLIDLLILSIIPITLGDGIPLFSKAKDQSGWMLVESHSYPKGVVQLRYELLT